MGLNKRRLLFPCMFLVLTIVSAAHCAEKWDVAQTARLLEAREAALGKLTLFVTIKEAETTGPDFEEYYDAIAQRRDAIFILSGQKPPVDPQPQTQQMAPVEPPPIGTRFAVDNTGRVRYEWLSKPSVDSDYYAVRTFNNKEWRHFSKDNMAGRIEPASPYPNEPYWIGLGLTWPRSGPPPFPSHKMSDAIREAERSGAAVEIERVDPAADYPEQVRLHCYFPEAGQVGERGVFTEIELWLNLALGLAPSRIQLHEVIKDPSGQFMPILEMNKEITGNWSEYEEIAPELWIARNYKETTRASLIVPVRWTPKTGQPNKVESAGI